MKKIITIIMALALVAAVAIGLVACKDTGITGGDGSGDGTITQKLTMPNANNEIPTAAAAGIDYSNIKIGMIFLHGDYSSYDANFINAANEVQAKLGLSDSQVIKMIDIAESEACTQAAESLVAQGCNIIFADSFDHEQYLLPVAVAHPNVQFFHATGVMAHTEELPNFHNGFASIYEGRFLAGIAAGLKLYEINSSLETKSYLLGYVGAYPYEEVKSGYTSYFLGAKYALNQKKAGLGDQLKMDVTFTNSWFDPDAEYAAASTLISRGCKVVSGHADSEGVPNACQENNIPNVFYNGTHDKAVYLCSSRINWAPYFEYIISQVAQGKTCAVDCTGTLSSGSVEVLELGSIAAEGTEEMINAAKAKLLSGDLQVFDLDTFTVGGKAVTSFMANVDSDPKYAPDHDVLSTGDKGINFVAESYLRSAPYFALDIDGITIIDKN